MIGWLVVIQLISQGIMRIHYPFLEGEKMRSTRNLKTQVVISVFLVMLGLTAVAGGKTIYVDAGATGVNKGSGADFQFDIQYPSIQAAIDAAVGGDIIILAPGTFGGDGNRDLDFKGKAITLCSTDPNDPNIVAATIIDCNGSEGHCHRGFYFHSGEDANSVVEGLTITNGFHGRGGGILCIASSPTIRNNVITGNKIEYGADGGGGIGCWDGASPLIVGNIISDNHCEPGGGGGGICCRRASSPTITDNIIAGNSASQGSGILCYGSPTISNCTFSGNTTTGMGGGILIDGSPVLTNCTFSGNSAIEGGGMYNVYSSPTVTDCNFSGNSASYGGGMLNEDSTPTLLNCTFSGNSASSDGGGMFNGCFNSAPTLLNCTFSGNDAGGDGGAMYNMYSRPILTNCIFSCNSASYGGGISIDWCSYSIMTNCIFISNSADIKGGGMNNYDCCFGDSILTNCIFWNNSDSGGMGESAQIYNHEGYGSCNPVINYSCVQEGYPGVGNIDTAPCFADANNGDYHLKSQAGRWNANEGRWTRDDVTSLCIDAGDMASPISYEPFPNGGIINMGAYGGTVEASKSYFGKPICETIVAGDINGDCIVNFKDFAFLAYHWLEDNNP